MKNIRVKRVNGIEAVVFGMWTPIFGPNKKIVYRWTFGDDIECDEFQFKHRHLNAGRAKISKKYYIQLPLHDLLNKSS